MSTNEQEPESVRLDREQKDRDKALKERPGCDPDAGSASLGPGGATLDHAAGHGEIEGDPPDTSD